MFKKMEKELDKELSAEEFMELLGGKEVSLNPGLDVVREEDELEESVKVEETFKVAVKITLLSEKEAAARIERLFQSVLLRLKGR